ncbi:hypothetical protein M0R04_15325 [Candidatus Dojkabacteria bacterium]|jgi:hypothetical protein|nr:hypothetical protein [Candidatus Dojkabacteria bacterium]
MEINKIEDIADLLTSKAYFYDWVPYCRKCISKVYEATIIIYKDKIGGNLVLLSGGEQTYFRLKDVTLVKHKKPKVTLGSLIAHKSGTFNVPILSLKDLIGRTVYQSDMGYPSYRDGCAPIERKIAAISLTFSPIKNSEKWKVKVDCAFYSKDGENYQIHWMGKCHASYKKCANYLLKERIKQLDKQIKTNMVALKKAAKEKERCIRRK